MVKEIYIRWLGIIVVGLIFPIILKSDLAEYWITALFSTFYTFLHWQVIWLIMQFYRRRYPKFTQTRQKLISELIAISSAVFIINIGLGYLIDTVLLNHHFEMDRPIRILLLAFIMSIAVAAVYEGFYFFEQLQKSVLETEKLRNENIQANFAVLKNQVSPHFLFNSFNTLMSIIPENQELALQFTEKLSSVYRYILENKDHEVVNLATELQFLESYIFLQKIRFGDNLIFKANIDEVYLDCSIPPLTLQLLAENAIKHNIVSSAKPLTVEIYVEKAGFLIVKNNLQRKNQVPESTQVGLPNIINRYKHLSNKEVDIIVTAENFLVALPLIKTNENIYASINH
jgi:hypothetical protein